MVKTIILIAIAGGLWANALLPLVMVRSAQAQNDMNAITIIQRLELIQHEIERLTSGTCSNQKLCGR